MGKLQGQLHDQEFHIVYIPEKIRQSGQATKELVAEAVAFLHRDGLVILENAVDTGHLDTLNAMLSTEALEIAADPNHHFNFGKETQNMDQAPPLQRHLMYKDIWCNPFASAVIAGILGPSPVVHYANGNTALRGTGRQPVHSDCEFAHPTFPFAMVVNINLVDTTPENGGTEVWLGSHHCSTRDEHVLAENGEALLEIKPEFVEERRKHSPPLQVSTKQGSLIIRDLRLWHAGMPNKTNDPRIMLAFVIQPSWFQGRSKVKLPITVKDLVDSWKDELQFDADWVDGEVDHKRIRSTNVDFNTKSESLEKFQDELAHRRSYYSPAY